MQAAVRVATFRLPPPHPLRAADFGRLLLSMTYPLAREEVHLAVLPGLFAMGLLPGGPSFGEELPRVLARFGGGLRDGYLATGARAARATGLYLIPGSLLLPVDDRHFVHFAALFDPSGEVVGTATSRVRGEEGPGLMTSGEVEVLDTAIGRLALLLGGDPWVPELARSAALQGAEILVAPLAPRAPYSAERALSGLWAACQGNDCYGLEAGLAGTWGHTPFAGRAAVVAPLAASSRASGFLPTAGYFVGEGAHVADLSADLLVEQRARREWERSYPADLYREQLLPAYRRGGAP